MEVANSPQNASSTASWDWRWLIGCHIVAGILVAVWILPPAAPWMDRLDRTIFQGLNQTLQGHPNWQYLCALANHRAMDAIAGVTLLALLVPSLRRPGQRDWRFALATLASMGVAIGVIRVAVGDGIVGGLLSYHRSSPSLVVPGALRLSQLVPAVDAKDASPWSFPGDHGFVLLTIAIFLAKRSGWKWGLGGLILAVGFSLPRLISGAHWTTDLLVGSLSLALLANAWLFGSPWMRWLERRGEVPRS